MPHKSETLQRIVALLEKDYPQATFRYLLDTKRFMGTRIVPDVQVFSPNDQTKPVCVVEVGYTRPEKLHHYKQSGITDVRWYGRDDGKLYSYGDVLPITHTIKVKYDFKPNPRDVWRSIDLDQSFDCDAAFEALNDLSHAADKVPTRFGKLRVIVKGIPTFLDHWSSLDGFDWDVVDYVIGDKRGKADNLDEAFSLHVYCTLWTNGRGAILTKFCDVCGDYRILDAGSVDWVCIEDEVPSYESFVYQFRKQVKESINRGWDAAEARARQEKTIEQLIEHLKGAGLTPAMLDAAKECGENLSWIQSAAVAA